MMPPWWFCCGWWSPWCVLDAAAHNLLRSRGPGDSLPGVLTWICNRHDAAIMKPYEEQS